VSIVAKSAWTGNDAGGKKNIVIVNAPTTYLTEALSAPLWMTSNDVANSDGIVIG
jgi:hypothetical protein